MGRLTLATFLALSLPLAAPSQINQGYVNFAGKWIAVPTPPGVDQPWCSLGSPLTLTQDTYALTAEWVSGGRSHAPVKPFEDSTRVGKCSYRRAEGG